MAWACAGVDAARTTPFGLPVVPEVYTIDIGACRGGPDHLLCAANQSS